MPALTELRSKEYDLIVFAVIFISMLLVVIFLAFSLLAYKVRAKNNVGKEMFYEKKWERFRKRSQNLQTF